MRVSRTSIAAVIASVALLAACERSVVAPEDRLAPSGASLAGMGPPADRGPDRTLTVTTSGTGSGMVTSSPAGIECGATCTAAFRKRTTVTLAATPSTGSTFTGWSGACTGTGSCVIELSSSVSVTAGFARQNFPLTVVVVGGGTVTGNGISCGMDCAESYDYGSMVTLTAMPATGYTFTGWSGGCTGTGACTVSITAATNVTAQFSLNTYALSVTTMGAGIVTGTGISCPVDCTESYRFGTSVTLTATPATGYVFWHWGGACSGSGSSCTVEMTAARVVDVAFAEGTALCAGAPQAKHSDGLGDAFFDCTPVATPGVEATYTVSLATEAAVAWDAAAARGTAACNGGSVLTATGTRGTAVWQYTGALAGRAQLAAPGNPATCPSSASPAWF